MASIRQSAYPDLLPDFRNMAVMARVLVAVNALALFGAFYTASNIAQGVERFVQAAAFVEPLVSVRFLGFFFRSPLRARRSYRSSCSTGVALAVAISGAYHGMVTSIATV